MSRNAPCNLLFVPGARPERFDKATATGADLICVDLEDAVAPAQKRDARVAAIEFLGSSRHTNIGIRVNALNTPFGIDDVSALLRAPDRPSFIMVPKVEHAEMVDWAADLFDPSISIVPIVESAKGLDAAVSIFAHPRVQFAVFGAVDYVADVGCRLTWDALMVPRVLLINAGAQNDVTLFDVPYTDVRDLEGLEVETRRTVELGMPARAAIHPDQIAVIRRAFAPSTEEIDYAQRVIEAFEGAAGSAALLDGKLIELPIIKAARRVLARRE